MNEDRPWIADGSETAEHEDFLIGNRAGLTALRSAIERALADGESRFEEEGIRYLGVRIVETDPRLIPRDRSGEKRQMVIFAVILLLLTFVFILGLRALPGLFQ